MFVFKQRMVVCPHGLFQLLLILAFSWFSISMDFIIDLPPFSSHESILVGMNEDGSFTNIITNERITKLFLDYDFQYHGSLEDIIYDYGLQFASKFWKWLFEPLGVKVKLSLTFHPQMDGQTKMG
jgi:hypothetical protein